MSVYTKLECFFPYYYYSHVLSDPIPREHVLSSLRNGCKAEGSLESQWLIRQVCGVKDHVIINQTSDYHFRLSWFWPKKINAA